MGLKQLPIYFFIDLKRLKVSKTKLKARISVYKKQICLPKGVVSRNYIGWLGVD